MSETPAIAGSASSPGWVGSIVDGIQRHQGAVLWGAIGFQLLVLVGMIALKAAVLVTGETLLLRVQPVDPRDLFRGDYVILSYAFSQVNPQEVNGLSVPSAGPGGVTVYAVLEPEADGRHWRAARFTASRPDGGRFLKGRYTGARRVEYGLESFFVQEGRGRDYEQAVRERRLSAQVAVDRHGNAVLQALVVE